MILEIHCHDRIGMATEVLDLFIPYDIDMKGIEVDRQHERMYCAFADIGFENLQKLMAEIRRIDGVIGVKTALFSPSQRVHNALYTLLKTLSDGVVSLDLSGYIMMANQTAIDDLQLGDQSIGQPLSQFLKGAHFSREYFSSANLTKLKRFQSKRVRVAGKTLLLEMLPIYVPGEEEGESVRAGTVVQIKSETRLGVQAQKLRHAATQDIALDQVVAKSPLMQTMVRHLTAFLPLKAPLFLSGEAGSGKQDLVNAMFQSWQGLNGLSQGKVKTISGNKLTLKHLSLTQKPQWWIISEPQWIGPEMQQAVLAYLDQLSDASFTHNRLVFVCSLSLEALAEQHPTQQAFLYRLAQLSLTLPPLRLRKQDLSELTHHYCQLACLDLNKPLLKVSRAAFSKLAMHSWPGNLTELRHVCYQACLLTSKNTIELADIYLTKHAEPAAQEVSVDLVDGSLDKTLKQFEAKLLAKLFPEYPSSRLLAEKVGLSHSAVANKLREYGINNKETNKKIS